jgi:translation initiation factor eIF-2B subunit gamma
LLNKGIVPSEPYDGLLHSSRWPRITDQNIVCSAYVLKNQTCIRANTIPNYLEANRSLIRKTPLISSDSTVKNIVGDSLLADGVKIGERSSVKKSVVGSNCSIGSNVKIIQCVLMDNVIVEDGCKLENCILAHKVVLHQKCTLSNCEVAMNTVLEKDTIGKNETFQ